MAVELLDPARGVFLGPKQDVADSLAASIGSDGDVCADDVASRAEQVLQKQKGERRVSDGWSGSR